MYFVGFSTATIVASLILFQGFNTSGGSNTFSLLAGFMVTFIGVHLLNISRKPDPPPLGSTGHHHTHSVLDGGLMNPRVSVSGRLSVDSSYSNGHAPYSGGHGRRSSLYRQQTPALHNAFEEEGGVALGLLREEEEDGDGEGTHERTRLTSGNGDAGHSSGGIR